ncbi:hypothetical protein E2C01_007436 [Portunus trituberculatus]|uniref:Uncharacterized protein n=1 Tax=Portunus trituberculatus TaxID=210409 RepID=A0A5B7D058_PORTR|nr:hypothetical protein [Portunus trituberculatus]
MTQQTNKRQLPPSSVCRIIIKKISLRPDIWARVYSMPGNTSDSRENNRGMSSATSLGTIVSHTL